MRQQVALVIFGHAIGRLLNLVGGLVGRCHVYAQRIGQQLAGQIADVFGISGREHQVLTLLGQQRADALDGMDETHVEHAVGFVQNKHLHRIKACCALLDQIHQTAGRGDQNVAAVAQLVDLRTLADAAKYHLRAQVGVLTIMLRAFGDLRRQFARGREDECTRCATLAGHQLLQHGQHKTCRLTGTGLSAGQHIATGQHRRDSSQLNRSGLRVAFFGHGSDELGT